MPNSQRPAAAFPGSYPTVWSVSVENDLRKGLAALQLDLSEAVCAKLLDYVALLAKWNRAYNLTAVRDPRQMVTRHILDSLAVLPYLHGTNILDVGTGAGLPGIPLALVSPQRNFVLLDSNGKKTRFVTQAVHELGLSNVKVARERVEAYRPGAAFDTIIARAFSSVGALAEAAGPLCAPGGRLLAMKGIYPVAELEQLPGAYVVREAVRLEVPGLDAERHLVIIERSEAESAGG